MLMNYKLDPPMQIKVDKVLHSSHAIAVRMSAVNFPFPTYALNIPGTQSYSL